jgi:hemicentin
MFVCLFVFFPRLFNGQEITPSGKYKIESKGNLNKLTIPKIDLIDTGIYEVIVSNGIDTIQSQSKLDVCIKPKVEGKPSDVNVNINEPAKLQCKISASPTPTITWLKDGQPVQPSDNITIQTELDGTQTLLFKSSQVTDKGSYTCQATNIGGTTEVKLNLNVQQIKPTIKSDLTKDIISQAGEPISLSIQASGTKPQVKWYKDGEEIIKTVEEEYEMVEEEETYTLLMKRPQPKDSGEYQAVITNDVGQIKSKKIKVQIQKAPQLKKKPEPIVNVKEGEQARFECEFDGNPSPKITWLRDGKPLTPKDGFEIKTDSTIGKSILIINHTTPKHSGPITLRLDNSVGTPIEEIVQLQVETTPQLLQKPPATCEAHLNQTATIPFKCLATPKPIIRLFKNDNEISLTSDHYELVTNPNDLTSYEIKIKNVQTEDEGNYRIRIENLLGNIESNIQVTTVNNITIQPLTKTINTDLKQHDILKLEYTVNGRPKPDIIFMKDGKEIKSSTKTQITYDETTNICRLITTDVGQEDQGIYTLIAKNKLGKQESEPIKINVTAPINIKKQLPEILDAILGEQTILTIEAEGIPQPKITWLFNGQPIKSSPKHKIETSKDNPHLTTLTITKLDISDAGKYTAIIDNNLEKIESNCSINIHSKPKLESKLEPTLTFNIGEQGQIPIRISGENNQITWFKDSQPIQFDDRIRLITEENNSYKLIIDNLRSEDKGLYSMHIENKGGFIDMKTTINIKEQKPQILTDLNDSPAVNTAKIGEEFSLELRAQGKPPPQLTWLLNGQELSTNSPDYDIIVTEDGLYRIVFRQFNERYIGEYQAVLTSSAGTIKTKKVKVTGQQIPIFTQEPSKFLQVKTGEKLTVECTAKGHPPPKISWLRDGKVLTNKDGYEIKIDQTTGQASFVIPNATMKHSGKYECKVENQYGTHTTEVDIDVLGKRNLFFYFVKFLLHFFQHHPLFNKKCKILKYLVDKK